MPYVLKKSDGSHEEVGQSNGNRQDQADSSFWITGWPAATLAAVDRGEFFTLVFPDGHSNSVKVKEKGGAGMGGLRFKLTG